MKIQALILSLLFSSSSFAWTLNNNFVASFEDNNVKVYIDSDTACNGIFYSDEFESVVKASINKYWNKVTTANLNLSFAGFSEPVLTMNHGRLCSPTDDDCITAARAAGQAQGEEGLIPSVDGIVIACNDNDLNFGGTNVLAVTVPNKFSGKKIKGAVILINADSTMGALTRDDQIGVIAHEVGHALGLGHTDKDEALMYYRIVDQRSRLGQDDIDGISFLYPMKGDLFGISEDGILGGCGTISTDTKNPPGNPPFLQMGIALGVLILIFELSRLFNRSKARSAT